MLKFAMFLKYFFNNYTYMGIYILLLLRTKT